MSACWGLTSGNAGMVAQVIALASAIGEKPVMKRVVIKKHLAWIPNIACTTPLRNFIVPYFIDPSSDELSPPWPELAISCGRRAAMVAIGLHHIIPQGVAKFIHIQDPHVSSSYFDLVVAMEHDKITGPNVIKSRFALHSITAEILRDAGQKFSARFAAYQKPYVAVLLGGSTNKYRFGKEAMEHLILELQRLLQIIDGALLITPSRRTGESNIAMLRNSFSDNPRVYIYDFIEDNPYMGLLALADSIVVTNDSVNMMSEAHATGKPLYILPLPGHSDTKPARFAQKLLLDGIARPVGNEIEIWSYPASAEMELLAKEIKKRLG